MPPAMHAPCHARSACGQTDACENITLPQTSFASGKYIMENFKRAISEKSQKKSVLKGLL